MPELRISPDTAGSMDAALHAHEHWRALLHDDNATDAEVTAAEEEMHRAARDLLLRLGADRQVTERVRP
jgi:hypothetical protein